jgi:release factor glutamine methyltransferase
MRVSEWVSQAATRLQETGVESAKLEAQVLAAHSMGISRSELLARQQEDVDAEALLERRLTGEPLAYILGYREFYGRRFKVGPAVLIPRQETEVLIDAALAVARAETVLDLATGSGCIGITLKLERPQLSVTLSDVSSAALEVAKENAAALEANVELIESDLFTGLDGRRFDLIVSNPPYVRLGDPLTKEIREFEPALALFAGSDGLDFYRRLAKEAVDHLKPNGRLLVEVGDGQGPDVISVFNAEGWRPMDAFSDLLGHQRVLVFPHGASGDFPSTL